MPVPRRNHLIDLARIGSMLIVVVFHALLWQVLLVDGRVRVDIMASGMGATGYSAAESRRCASAKNTTDTIASAQVMNL